MNEWFPTQTRFSDWAELAREIHVSRRTVLDWRNGKHPPVRSHRRKLYELTGLSCFADAADWKPRETPARKSGEKAAVPLLHELVVRCGLATREIQQIRMSHIQNDGIRLSNGRFIPFGERWEEVNRSSFDEWRDRAKPTELLFFSRKPVDRQRPASGVWMTRALHASGVSMQRTEVARASRWNRSKAGRPCANFSGKNFSATQRPRVVSSALYSTHMPPPPSLRRMR